MLVDYKEESIKCSGKLSQYLTLFLRINHEIIKDKHKISLRLRITRNKNVLDSDMNRLVNLKENQVTAQIRVADKVLIKKSVPIDFMSDNINNITLVEYQYEISNEQTLLMNYYGDLIINNDKSEYLKNTTIKSNLILTPIKNNKLFIELTKSELLKHPEVVERGYNKEDLIYYHYNLYIKNTITPDFLEIKINSNDWEKIELDKTNIYQIPAVNYKRYIQIRGKKDNYYSYSNIIKIDADNDLK